MLRQCQVKLHAHQIPAGRKLPPTKNSEISKVARVLRLWINRKFEKFRKGKACVNDEVYIYIALRLQIYSTKFNPIVCTVISRNELQW